MRYTISPLATDNMPAEKFLKGETLSTYWEILQVYMNSFNL
jgi:hypothetical protein